MFIDCNSNLFQCFFLYNQPETELLGLTLLYWNQLRCSQIPTKKLINQGSSVLWLILNTVWWHKGQNPFYQHRPVTAPFFPPGNMYRTPPALSVITSLWWVTKHNVPCVPGTPVPSAIMTKKPICAALPSLPHTRVTLSRLNGRFFQNVMQIRNRHAVSTG